MNNIMIDIETLGTDPNSVTLAIAAVEFDKAGRMGRFFYRKIELQSALNLGLQIDQQTLIWWSTQKPVLFKELFDDAQPLESVMQLFVKWFNPEIKTVWANSPSFDLVIIKNILKKLDLPVPWKYHSERDFRTLKYLFKETVAEVPKPENAHNALADCEYQINCVSRVLKLYLKI